MIRCYYVLLLEDWYNTITNKMLTTNFVLAQVPHKNGEMSFQNNVPVK